MLTTTMMIMTNKAITIAAITKASERNESYKLGKNCKKNFAMAMVLKMFIQNDLITYYFVYLTSVVSCGDINGVLHI